VLHAKTIALIVSGSIAAYKSANLIRELRRRGAAVRVVMTRSAAQFVAPLTFEALSEHPVEIDPFRSGESIRHIALAREADAIVIAPATAHILARLALGLADDAPTALVLASRSPLVIAPAMNTMMWQHEATQQNLRTLHSRGAHIIEPEAGPLACGETGAGRLPDAEVIADRVERILSPAESPWRGRRVLITAGGTEEPIDAVRVLTNRSSGRMGVTLAAAAERRGAVVELILARHTVAPPAGVEVQHALTADAMGRAVRERLPAADVLIMAAAVADFCPEKSVRGKISRSGGGLTLKLVPTIDILAAAAASRRPEQLLIGFALETDDIEERARRKLQVKGIDLIVANQAATALDRETNQVTIFAGDGSSHSLDLASKEEIAAGILDYAGRYLRS
jgi:phosphopantothenoylcysteine decarboxylase/phosphopantothenate--cysteine ligase